MRNSPIVTKKNNNNNNKRLTIEHIQQQQQNIDFEPFRLCCVNVLRHYKTNAEIMRNDNQTRKRVNKSNKKYLL